jgi:hypothetical protein
VNCPSCGFVNGSTARYCAIGLSEPRGHDANGRVFRAVLPGQSDGTVEFLPVLRFAGQPISPCLEESVEYPRYRVGGGAVPVEAADSSAIPSTKSASEPRWDWDSTFLWTGAVAIRKEVVGALPDGLRINWHVTEGRFVGPRLLLRPTQRPTKSSRGFNRAQCIGVGRMDIKALRAEYDIYIVAVGGCRHAK